jgi:hypothetical protein
MMAPPTSRISGGRSILTASVVSGSRNRGREASQTAVHSNKGRRTDEGETSSTPLSAETSRQRVFEQTGGEKGGQINSV